MALTAQLMQSMDDDHLVMALRAEIDPLTSTAAEIILLDRFETLLDEKNPALDAVFADYEIEAEGLQAVCESHPASLKEMAELLQVLSDDDIHTPDQLRAKLERSDKFFDIATDAGDVLSRLADLAKTTQ
jgi:hypothetical protein